MPPDARRRPTAASAGTPSAPAPTTVTPAGPRGSRRPGPGHRRPARPPRCGERATGRHVHGRHDRPCEGQGHRPGRARRERPTPSGSPATGPRNPAMSRHRPRHPHQFTGPWERSRMHSRVRIVRRRARHLRARCGAHRARTSARLNSQIPCGAKDMRTPPRLDTVHMLGMGHSGRPSRRARTRLLHRRPRPRRHVVAEHRSPRGAGPSPVARRIPGGNRVSPQSCRAGRPVGRCPTSAECTPLPEVG